MKEKKPVIPHTKLSREESPLNKSNKYNWRYVDGDFVADRVDDKELPVDPPIMPKKKKKGK